MTKQTINPPALFDSIQYGFSQIVTTTGGTTVHISGQVAWNAERETVGDNLADQVEQSLKNIETAMQAAGGALNDVVSMRIYIVEDEMVNSQAVSAGLRRWFSAENRPATTWIGVRMLADPSFLIEIEGTGVIHK